MAVCEICLRSPCLTGCPNEVIQIIGYCKKCRCDIEIGMKYLDHDSGYICEDCLDEMTTTQLLDLFGEELQVAAKEDYA